MGLVNETTERLIVRKLDGELSAAEEHEFNKVLIRSPDGRRLLEEYLEQDRLAAEVLAEEVGHSPPGLREEVAAGLGPPPNPRRTASWWRSSVGGLMVACLALFAVLWRPALLPIPGRGKSGMNLAGSAAAALPVATGEEFRQLPEGLQVPQTQERVLDRRLIGVYDQQTDRYYVLEVRRVTTSTRMVSERF
jgi:anti-sigma factor RsiW